MSDGNGDGDLGLGVGETDAMTTTTGTTDSVYDLCASLHATQVDEITGDAVAFDHAGMYRCISSEFDARLASSAYETTGGGNGNGDDFTNWLFVIAGSLIFFMQAGFAMLCAGCVRRKNVQNTMLKNLLDACGAGIAYYCVGYAFTFGGQNDHDAGHDSITFLGTENFFLRGIRNEDLAFWFFEYAFSAASVTIVAGTLAERCQMAAYLWYSMVLTGFVYPVVAHAVWSNNGFLSTFAKQRLLDVGCIDFAGSGVVHLTGGTTAFMATWILGARRGRFTDARGRLLAKPREFPGHSIALQLMGTMTLWFGCTCTALVRS